MSDVGDAKVNVKYRKLSDKQRLLWVLPTGLVVAFSVFGFLAANGKFDVGSNFGVCGFYQKYQMPCPSCGMSRAVIELYKGDLVGSVKEQPAAIVLIILAVGVSILGLVTAFKGVSLVLVERIKLKYIVFFVIIIVIAGWVWRLVMEM